MAACVVVFGTLGGRLSKPVLKTMQNHQLEDLNFHLQKFKISVNSGVGIYIKSIN